MQVWHDVCERFDVPDRDVQKRLRHGDVHDVSKRSEDRRRSSEVQTQRARRRVSSARRCDRVLSANGPATIAGDVVTAKELMRRHAKMTDAEFSAALRSLNEHQKDLCVVCKACGSGEGVECNPKHSLKKRALRKGEVHFGRRLSRLMAGLR